MKVIVLHNRHDRQSREFVESLPATSRRWFAKRTSDLEFCVLDWYSDDSERVHRTCKCHAGQVYEGPPPSAFPELAWQDEDGTWIRVRLVQSIEDIKDTSKHDRMTRAYWAGQHHEDIQAHIDNDTGVLPELWVSKFKASPHYKKPKPDKRVKLKGPDGNVYIGMS